MKNCLEIVTIFAISGSIIKTQKELERDSKKKNLQRSSIKKGGCKTNNAKHYTVKRHRDSQSVMFDIKANVECFRPNDVINAQRKTKTKYIQS